jgi:hypothetical protein
MSSPTQRTLAELRKRGAALVQVVERWNAFAKVRVDLFGVIDVLAVMPSGKTVAVQATSGANVAARVDKIVSSDAYQLLRLAGWTILVHGWRKNAKGRYVLREVDLS